jgi:hypothetical protein
MSELLPGAEAALQLPYAISFDFLTDLEFWTRVGVLAGIYAIFALGLQDFIYRLSNSALAQFRPYRRFHDVYFYVHPHGGQIAMYSLITFYMLGDTGRTSAHSNHVLGVVIRFLKKLQMKWDWMLKKFTI